MPRHSDAREKMIKSAVRVMRERGVEAMSFNDVLTRADAPRGSVYHHFPLGKAQLVREATQWAGDFMADEERAAVAGGSLAALRLLVEYWRRILVGSDFAAGCPIVAVTVDGAAPPDMPAVELDSGLPEALSPMPLAVAGQLLAHEVAKARGIDPDAPRALHKITRTW